MPKTELANLICQQCGREFIEGKRTKFCPQCRKKRNLKYAQAYRGRRAERYIRRIGETYTCIDCGAEYMLTSGLQVCCRQCERSMDPPLPGASPDERKCPWCGRTFVDPRATVDYCSRECAEAAVDARSKLISPAKTRIRREKKMLAAKTALQVLRMAAGLSQTQLARISGVKQGVISDYERGVHDVRRMTDAVAGRLAKALHCTIADIREENPNEP